MKKEQKTVVLDNNIATWVRLHTDMTPYGLIVDAIKGGQSEWTEISKQGTANQIKFPSEAYVWRFREFFTNEWVADNAEAITEIGFRIYSSRWGNFLVHPANTLVDAHWKKLKKLFDER